MCSRNKYTSLHELMKGDDWTLQYRERAMRPWNGGYSSSYPIRGSGSDGPLPIYSNSKAFLYNKRGKSGLNFYSGNIQPFQSGVTEKLRDAVRECTRETLDPSGCQRLALRSIGNNC